MLLIFTSAYPVPSRLAYSVKVIANLLGINSYRFTNDEVAYAKAENVVKISYNKSPIIANALWIRPHDLLFESGIQQQKIDTVGEGKQLYFFETNGQFPFDIFAATFYLITRYEEYLTHEKDSYGRYAHTESLAYKCNFLSIPLVNYWVKYLKEQLEQKGFLLNIPSEDFQFIPTYDVDIAFQYAAQPWYKIASSILKHTVKGNFSAISEIYKVLLGKKKDAFNVFEWLTQLHSKYKLTPIYFFLLAKRRAKYDKNNSCDSKAFQQFIQGQATVNMLGIHPSYQAANNEYLLQEEVKFLEKVIGKKVTKSRHHYVKITLPQTYESLHQLGIAADYSMGYGSINGFRASIASAYEWYNLASETATSLTIYPFCFMDANSHFEQHFSAKQAGQELQYYYHTCKEVNAPCISIFHNHFLVDDAYWQPWRNMYESFLYKNLP